MSSWAKTLKNVADHASLLFFTSIAHFKPALSGIYGIPNQETISLIIS
jgi:hypothetical protein